MLRTSVSTSKQNQLCAKCNLSPDFGEKNSVNSLLLEILWRLNAIFIAFYTSNVVHAVFSFERSTTACKSQQFIRVWGKISVISFLLDIFRHLNAIFARFKWASPTHVCFNIQTSTTVPKMQRFTRFWRKNRVISLRLGILWRLNAIFLHFTLWT